MVVTWREMHGEEPHHLVVYFFCGVNLLKLGSEWKCIGLWLQNGYYVSPIIYTNLKFIFLHHMIESN